ncbi:MAG: hypothetical protein IJM75_07610 [Ruminococcus sp.]|nr:hypothetical protein [Ruminococcus sp.]
MEKKEYPKTSTKLLEWKNSSKSKKEHNGWPISVEYNNKDIKKLWGEECECDTLYSFLGIYAIGIWAYNHTDYPKLFEIKENTINVKKSPYKKQDWRNLWSKKYCYKIQKGKHKIKVGELNKDIKPFVNVYFSVGNVIPIWPGGNTNKGNIYSCSMDIPEIYFKKYRSWFDILKNKYPNAYLEKLDISNERFNSLKIFLNSVDTPDKYKKFLEYIVDVIKYREKSINNKTV